MLMVFIQSLTIQRAYKGWTTTYVCIHLYIPAPPLAEFFYQIFFLGFCMSMRDILLPNYMHNYSTQLDWRKLCSSIILDLLSSILAVKREFDTLSHIFTYYFTILNWFIFTPSYCSIRWCHFINGFKRLSSFTLDPPNDFFPFIGLKKRSLLLNIYKFYIFNITFW